MVNGTRGLNGSIGAGEIGVGKAVGKITETGMPSGVGKLRNGVTGGIGDQTDAMPGEPMETVATPTRESHGKTGKGDVMPGVRRDEMEEMEEDEMDEMDNVKSGETGAMNGVVSTRAVGKVDPLWIVILPVLQIQHESSSFFLHG